MMKGLVFFTFLSLFLFESIVIESRIEPKDNQGIRNEIKEELLQNILNLYWYTKDVKPPQENIIDLYSYSKDREPRPSVLNRDFYALDLYFDGKNEKPRPNILDLYGYFKDLESQLSILERNSYRNDPIIRMEPTTNRNPPIEKIFFNIKDLKVGRKLPFYFPQKGVSTPAPSLPKEIADSIPFSLKQFPQILNLLSIPLNSPQAQDVKNALLVCELKPMKGEFKQCTTSKQTMLDSSISILGLENKSHLKNLTTFHFTNPHAMFQNYTITQLPKEIPIPKFFACHLVPYPYEVYLCHSPGGGTKVLRLPLEGDNGDRVDALAVCHMDTSNWTPRHPSFLVLNSKPGTPVCHVFPDTDFLWTA